MQYMSASESRIPNPESLIVAALAEDIGSGDITSELLIPESAQATIGFVAREEMIACGTFIPAAVYHQLSPSVKVQVWRQDGQHVKKNTVLATATGPARALLTGERVALNLMQRMSGVATLTHDYVKAVAGTKAVILDTRKTIPGMRALDKYAVTCGGGKNHRMGLYDAVLIKDNHIAVGIRDSGLGIRELVEDVRKKLSFRIPNPESRTPVFVECDTIAQVEEALAAKSDRILLDNMDVKTLRQAVKLVGGKIPLEASGGVSLENIRAIAETGVDFISVGKLTHSAPAADIGADVTIGA